MSATPAPAAGTAPESARPHVVMVRPTGIENDSRVKKIAVSLDRLGYRVTVLGRSGDTKRHQGTLSAAQVLMVPPRSRLRGAPQRVVRLPRRAKAAEQRVNQLLQRLERSADTRLRRLETSGAYLFHAAQRDFRTTYGSELVRLLPDVIHVHDPRLLPVAFRAARKIARRTERPCEVVYDARENFAGVLETQEALPRYHRKVLGTESRFAPRTAALLTVSGAVAEALSSRLALERPPTVLLNVPVARPLPSDASGLRSLRSDAGVPDGAPILVYPGAASRARGVDTIIEALVHLPTVHAVLVVVPWPHPRASELHELAESLGVAHRLHLVEPVPADDVPRYLSGADVAVHAMLGGIPNHEMALPNKLFEILHAGLPMASSDVRTMAAFVREHDMGEVFRAGDPVDLARAVDTLLRERAGRPSAGRAELVERFSWQAQEQALGAAYGRFAPTPPVPSHPYPPLDVVWA
jgi:glycosyltransferase involved in cell wall biosynthesis